MQTNNPQQYYESLFKLKAFPNQTLVFPSHEARLEDLMFIKTLDPKNEVLDLKIDSCKQALVDRINLEIPLPQ